MAKKKPNNLPPLFPEKRECHYSEESVLKETEDLVFFSGKDIICLFNS